jgi:cytosine/adenosine deaminase-related metal-dependent hydrolase
MVSSWEGDCVVHVGAGFSGAVDEEIDARGKLVCPGFIDTHVHSGHRASHRLISDAGRPDYFGQPFLEITVPRQGTVVGGDPRYARPDAPDAETGNRLLARFTVAELLRNGITTFMEFGSQLRVQDALLEEVERLGVRAYLGAGYDSDAARRAGPAHQGRRRGGGPAQFAASSPSSSASMEPWRARPQPPRAARGRDVP